MGYCFMLFSGMPKCLKCLLFTKLFIILLSIEDFLIFRYFRHLGLININGKLIKQLSCT